ncbi:hypothetical protein GCM10023354_07760 [Garicola koreensis]
MRPSRRADSSFVSCDDGAGAAVPLLRVTAPPAAEAAPRKCRRESAFIGATESSSSGAWQLWNPALRDRAAA